LGADSRRAQIRSSAVGGTSTRSRRRIAQVVRVDRVSAARAPANGERIDVVKATEVCPFAEIRFAKNHGTGCAQLVNDHGISWHAAVDQRKRARRCLHLIGGRNVVLYEKRNAVKRSAHMTMAAFVIEIGGDHRRIWI